MHPTYIFSEIDNLQNVFRRLNIACEIQVKRLPMTSSGKCIIGNFYYTGGNHEKEPYFLATIVGYTPRKLPPAGIPDVQRPLTDEHTQPPERLHPEDTPLQDSIPAQDDFRHKGDRMSINEEFDELQRYRELFKRHFGLKFDYGWAGARDGNCKYITLTKDESGYNIICLEAYGDSFAACIHTLQKRLCTHGLIPDIDNFGPFPPFSSANELEMKLSIAGK